MNSSVESEASEEKTIMSSIEKIGGHKQEKEVKTYRKYQALRDFTLISEKPNMLDYYMELIIQFGYIVLFSMVFPLAGLMSLISNSLQIHSQVANFKYCRRFKPDVSNGIGNWESCLSQLSQFSIIINSSIIFFTSKMYYKMFVDEGKDESNQN